MSEARYGPNHDAVAWAIAAVIGLTPAERKRMAQLRKSEIGKRENAAARQQAELLLIDAGLGPVADQALADLRVATGRIDLAPGLAWAWLSACERLILAELGGDLLPASTRDQLRSAWVQSKS